MTANPAGRAAVRMAATPLTATAPMTMGERIRSNGRTADDQSGG
jgi:hypothetical protein